LNVIQLVVLDSMNSTQIRRVIDKKISEVQAFDKDEGVYIYTHIKISTMRPFIMKEARRFSLEVRPWVKKSAITGVDGVLRIFFNSLQKFTPTDLRAFDDWTSVHEWFMEDFADESELIIHEPNIVATAASEIGDAMTRKIHKAELLILAAMMFGAFLFPISSRIVLPRDSSLVDTISYTVRAHINDISGDEIAMTSHGSIRRASTINSEEIVWRIRPLFPRSKED
jgi:hypothetical protein